MITIDVIQGSPEWIKERVGIPTSSNFDKIITTGGKPSKQKTKYMYQLVAERITGIKEDTYQNAIMQHSIVMEEEARNMYEFIKEVTVKQVGFCCPNEKKLCGCSPDGLIGKDGAIEIKCPLPHTHIAYLLDGTLPADYFQQVQGQLFVTGRKWVDFFSYYPGLKPLLIRVEPDKVFQKALQIELEIFVQELDEITEKIRSI